jgi:hypothetical protein
MQQFSNVVLVVRPYGSHTFLSDDVLRETTRQNNMTARLTENIETSQQ